MYSEILLDCRELEAPEPLNLVTSNLSNLNEKSYIKMVHRIEPTPLLNMLKSNGYEYIVKESDSDFIIYICNSDYISVFNYIKEL